MKYQIRKKFHHKNYVFLLSVTEGSAIWSVHEYDGGTNISLAELSNLFQKGHDKQIDQLLLEAKKDEPLEFQTETILDLTADKNN